MQNITFIPTTEPKQKPETSKLGFGKHFTDHMFVMEYSPDQVGTMRESCRLAIFPCIPLLRFFIMARKFLKA